MNLALVPPLAKGEEIKVKSIMSGSLNYWLNMSRGPLLTKQFEQQQAQQQEEEAVQRDFLDRMGSMGLIAQVVGQVERLFSYISG